MNKKIKKAVFLIVMTVSLLSYVSANEYIYPDDFEFTIWQVRLFQPLKDAVKILVHGDELFIRKGIHNARNIIIPGGVTIEGEGPALTVLDGGRIYASSVLWSGDQNTQPLQDVNIRNLTLKDSGWGISTRFINSNISNCIFFYQYV